MGLLISGCAIPPRDRSTPTVPVPTSWSVKTDATKDVGKSWWDAFGEPELTRVINEAIRSNADLVTLAERVKMARAEGGLLTAQGQPGAEASTSIRVGKENTQASGLRTVDLKPWTFGGVMKWELDWLGKWRDRRAAVIQSVRASEADFHAGRLLIAAEVATAWFQLHLHRAEDENLDFSLKRQEKILAIYRDRYQAGIVDLSIVENQEAEAADLKRHQIRARMNADTQVRRLDRLLGNASGMRGYHGGLLKENTAIASIPDDLPTEVLRRRPDLVAAEARLLAAFSLERAAHLDLFPSLSLRLSGVTASSSLTDPFQRWMSEVGPRLDFPIWDPERLAQSRIHNARAKVIAAEYRAAVLRAIEDVERSLVQFHYRRVELKLAQEIVNKRKSVWKQTEEKRFAGIVSQLEVYKDERRKLAAELNEISIRTELLIDIVAIFRAMAVTEKAVTTQQKTDTNRSNSISLYRMEGAFPINCYRKSPNRLSFLKIRRG
jgi:outer membrane protein, multidrug efflux system